MASSVPERAGPPAGPVGGCSGDARTLALRANPGLQGRSVRARPSDSWTPSARTTGVELQPLRQAVIARPTNLRTRHGVPVADIGPTGRAAPDAGAGSSATPPQFHSLAWRRVKV